MQYYGLRVYDIGESIVASGLPMKKSEYTPEEFEWEVKNLNYWLSTGVIDYLYNQEFSKKLKRNGVVCEGCGSTNEVQKYKDIGVYCLSCRHMLSRHGYIKDVHRRTPNRIDVFKDRAEIVTTDNNGVETARYIVDHESLPKLINYKWSHSSNGYANTHSDNVSLHRLIALDEDELNDGKIVVDHIDRNPYNNKMSNLRVTDNTNNCRNSSICKSNTSGIIGVSFRKGRNVWRAFITVNRKRIHLGSYSNLEDAIKARLEGELKYFGEFSPQLELFDKYGIPLPSISSLSNKASDYNLYNAWTHFKRMVNLGSAVPNSGHDCAEKGILVNVNIKADQSFWLQWERYSFQDTISSMSTMHCLCKFEDLPSMFSEHVDPRSIAILEEKIDEYNANPTKENFHKVIHNCPEGIELTRRVSTNYLQLKTMLNQREFHKMYSWSKDFVNMCKELPYFYEFIGRDRDE